MNPAVRPILVKPAVPAEHTLVLTVAAGQEDAVLPAHLPPDQAALGVVALAVQVEVVQVEDVLIVWVMEAVLQLPKKIILQLVVASLVVIVLWVVC